MRERLDCALLAVDQQDWTNAVTGAKSSARLTLHPLATGGDAAVSQLADPAMLRGRYDAGLIYVDEASLGIWRQALASQAGGLPPALIIYAVGLRAQGIRDLLALGATDFMRPPFCIEELRARIEHLLIRRLPAAHLAEYPKGYEASAKTSAATIALRLPGHTDPLTEARLCETILERSGTELEAYAVALATQRATSRASFRAAKSEVVARFERAYIRAALGRHGGNITLAAQTAQKHRRAFWALMRKHDIDPKPYRGDPADGGPRPTGSG